MGFAPRDGPISRLGNRAQEHAIGLPLSLVDLLFFENGGETANSALSVVRFIAALISAGNLKQAFGGHVAYGTWPMCLVENRWHSLASYPSTCAIWFDIRPGQCLDDLGTEVPRWRNWL